jgi:hypothetical protein
MALADDERHGEAGCEASCGAECELEAQSSVECERERERERRVGEVPGETAASSEHTTRGEAATSESVRMAAVGRITRGAGSGELGGVTARDEDAPRTAQAGSTGAGWRCRRLSSPSLASPWAVFSERASDGGWSARGGHRIAAAAPSCRQSSRRESAAAHATPLVPPPPVLILGRCGPSRHRHGAAARCSPTADASCGCGHTLSSACVCPRPPPPMRVGFHGSAAVEGGEGPLRALRRGRWCGKGRALACAVAACRGERLPSSSQRSAVQRTSVLALPAGRLVPER